MDSFIIDNDNVLHYSVQDVDTKVISSGQYTLDNNELFGIWLSQRMTEICRNPELSRIIRQSVENYFKPHNGEKVDPSYSTLFLRHQAKKGKLDRIFKEYARPEESDLVSIAKQKAEELGTDEEFFDWMKTVLVGHSLDVQSIGKYTKSLILGGPFIVSDDGNVDYTSYWQCSTETIAKSIYKVKIWGSDSKICSYKRWLEDKHLILAEWFFQCYKEKTWLQAYPYYYIYDLLFHGDLCGILFDVLNDSTIKTSHKVQLYKALNYRRDATDSEHLRMVDSQYEPYRLLGGSNLHFWPWNYAVIAEDFRRFYRECTLHSQRAKLPHGFIDICLPEIVEEILPSIKNATEAVGLILLIRNAKDFDAEWKTKKKDEEFKYRMANILRLHEFDDKLPGFRFRNPQVRERSVELYDRYPILRRFTNTPEGD